jgi:fructose-bisphosphate aldolase class 1
MFKHLKNYKINKFKKHKRSYRKYCFKFIDSKIKCNIWWDCTFKQQITTARNLAGGSLFTVQQKLIA